MRMKEPKIDELLMSRLAAMGRVSQRWLKTTLHALRAIEEAEPRSQKQAREPSAEAPAKRPSVEDMIAGDANLDEIGKAYPELAEALEGMSDVSDLLRELGRRRRELGREHFGGREEEKGADED